MKKYLVLFLAVIAGGAALLFLFIHSNSQLISKHDAVVKLFIRAKQEETDLEKNLLKSRSFLLENYDPIANGEQDIEQLCFDFKDKEMGLYHSEGESRDLDEAVDNYCQELGNKLKTVEAFKSKSSILRNSLFFIQQIDVEKNLSNQKERAHSNLSYSLIESVISYTLVPTDEARIAVNRNIQLAEKSLQKSKNEKLASLLKHSEKVFQIKAELDLLTMEVSGKNPQQTLENVRRIYLQNYNRSEQSAKSYRELLSILCAILFIAVIYGIVKILRTARALSEANQNLEQKVVVRTADLLQSQEVILQQQQALVVSSKLSALGEMAGGIAHELNNPLAILQIRIDQLEEAISEGTLDIELLKKIADVSNKMIRRMSKIIAGLRSFSRDSSRDPVAEIKVSEMIEDTFSLCREKFTNHGVLLELIMPEELKINLTFSGRSTELSQVLVNLLNNAYDAISGLQEKWIRVEASDLGDQIEISVTDSGAGIPPEIQQKMMQPFFTTKEVGKGTGLGLSISKGIVEGHRGRFFIENSCKNTQFKIVLPKSAASESELKKTA